MSPPTHFPLRWESTGDQWWYASPIDWAAANGHYDLVRELLNIDPNHLIKLTSLRRIRRLESVWDDDSAFHHVARSRSLVARRLLADCESKKGRNSLMKAGYGGWLLYTAASAGDLGFVRDLLERDPLLVFGEGEYGVTDVLYAAARSKDRGVFRLVLDFASSPRLSTGKGGELEEHVGEIPAAYRWEVRNRAAHAAARGGNLEVLREILGDCCSTDDVLSYRDVSGSSILHAAASKGQVEVVKYLMESFDMIDCTDNRGNTALHIAAYKGQLAAVQAMVTASPRSIFRKNCAGETFLHKAVAGFEAPAFKRLDRQMELMRQLIRGSVVDMEDIVNEKNDLGRTALHAAIHGNVHLELVQLLMTVRGINVNIRDKDGMTPLDLIKQRPPSASSDILIRRLISAGAMFGTQDFSARKAIASQLKMQGSSSSPGTSFKVADSEILLHTGIENAIDPHLLTNAGTLSSSFDSTAENEPPIITRKPGTSATGAALHLRKVLLWPHKRKKSAEDMPMPVPLRQRFSNNPSTARSIKRTLSVRSNVSSPSNRKKLASGVRRGLLQAMPQLNTTHHTPSGSFSMSSVSSLHSVKKPKESSTSHESIASAAPSCSNKAAIDDDTPSLRTRRGLLRRKYFCFGGSSIRARKPVSRKNPDHNYIPAAVPSVA
ncbi:hypothetical protein MLD38_013245 [Melastoma candidum]|uniref:Uncharacterized protein n=1 Tax=Melastoma candidum TaxID=119954 RepID=A0ACB9R9K3_9MYRT|nr:hypothetical protein MLD38_013245 [Melastoma candidum]